MHDDPSPAQEFPWPDPQAFSSTAAAAGVSTIAMPCLSRAADRPQITHGVQSGDVSGDGGVIWARADRPSQMQVEVATTELFKDARKLPPIAALPESDFTAKMLVEDLPGGQDIFYRVRFRDLAHVDVESEPVVGRFRTAPSDKRDVSFVWGGDVAGQGWGINPDDGGMFTFAAMRKNRPDFFLHSGDTIYADGLIPSEVKLADGKLWKNVTIPEKGQGRRDARRVPRRAQVQFPRREPARLQCRSADLRAVGRPRGHQQLVALEGSVRRPTRSATSRCSPRARPARSTRCIRCARASSSPAGSIARSATARISTSSCSTSAAIAAPTARTSRPLTAPTPTSSVPTRCAG